MKTTQQHWITWAGILNSKGSIEERNQKLRQSMDNRSSNSPTLEQLLASRFEIEQSYRKGEYIYGSELLEPIIAQEILQRTRNIHAANPEELKKPAKQPGMFGRFFKTLDEYSHAMNKRHETIPDFQGMIQNRWM